MVMFKIGDFSRLSRVPVKTLRYYDEIGLLKPVTVDQFNGYRYYSAGQLTRLNRIIGLKNLGLSLEEIAQFLSSDMPVPQILDMLRKRQLEIQQQLGEEQAKLVRVEEWLKQIEKEGTMPAYEVVIKKVEATTVASVRDIIPNYGQVGRLYGEIFTYLGRNGIRPAGPPMAIYHDGEYKEQEVDVEAAIPVSKELPGNTRVKISKLPVMEQVACAIHQGDYKEISRAYNALMAWIESNGYQIADRSREIYLRGPGDTQDVKSYVTEVQFPVNKI